MITPVSINNKRFIDNSIAQSNYRQTFCAVKNNITTSVKEKKETQNNDFSKYAAYTLAATAFAMYARSRAQLVKVQRVAQDALITAGEQIPSRISKMISKLGDIATKDALSGILNRRSYDAAVKSSFASAQKEGKNLSVAMMDMDYFKSVNDVLGHDVGDLFIKRIGNNIDAVCQKYGISGYRYGGEEFSVVMPNLTKTKGKQITLEIAEKIKKDPAMQDFKTQFLDTAKTRLAELQKNQAKLEDIFKQIKGERPCKRPRQLANELSKMLKNSSSAVTKADKKEFEEFISCLKKARGEELKTLLNPQAKLAESKILGKELNKLHNHNREISALQSWVGHVESNGFTISAGVSDLQKIMKSPEELVKAADKTLEFAKQHGRNSILAN